MSFDAASYDFAATTGLDLYQPNLIEAARGQLQAYFFGDNGALHPVDPWHTAADGYGRTLATLSVDQRRRYDALTALITGHGDPFQVLSAPAQAQASQYGLRPVDFGAYAATPNGAAVAGRSSTSATPWLPIAVVGAGALAWWLL